MRPGYFSEAPPLLYLGEAVDQSTAKKIINEYKNIITRLVIKNYQAALSKVIIQLWKWAYFFLLALWKIRFSSSLKIFLHLKSEGLTLLKMYSSRTRHMLEQTRQWSPCEMVLCFANIQMNIAFRNKLWTNVSPALFSIRMPWQSTHAYNERKQFFFRSISTTRHADSWRHR